jgi:hypothetical protein
MTPSWTEVNAAVLAVLGEFGRARGSNGRHFSANSDQDLFVERLFSVRHAEAVADGEEVRVAAGTVVTPLASDLLRRRKIRLRVVSGREASLKRSQFQGEWGFAIESRSRQVEAIRRMLLDDWHEVGADAIEAAHWVVGGDGRGALVLADEASVATWRAARIDGIRAATVAAPESVTRAIRHLGANLIVVEPLGASIYWLKQVGERFRQGGAPTLPEWLQDTEVGR